MQPNSAQLSNPKKSSFMDGVSNAVSGAEKTVNDTTQNIIKQLAQKLAEAGYNPLTLLGNTAIEGAQNFYKQGVNIGKGPQKGESSQQYADRVAPDLVKQAPMIAGLAEAPSVKPNISAPQEILDSTGNIAQSKFVGGQSPKPGEPPAILDQHGNPMKSTVEAPIKEGGYATPNANPATGKDMRPNEQLPNIPQTKTNTNSGTLSHPEVPLTPEDVSATRTGTHPLTKGNPVLVDLRSEAKRNPFYLEDQTKAREVMDKYVPGNTPTEVEYNLPKKLAEESKRIKNIIGNDPQRINISDLVSQNEAALKSQGYTPGTSTKADSATRGALNDLDSQVGVHENAPGKAQVSGNDLENYKKILDKKLQSVYKKMDLGTTLTPEETSLLTMRRTINNNLRTMYPEVGDALDRQSAMIDARPSVAKAAGAQEVADTTAANAPKPNKINAFLTDPKTKIASGVVGAGGLLEIGRGGKDLPPVAEMSANLFNPNINKDSGTPSEPISATLPTHMPLQDIKDKTGAQITMDEYQQKRNDPAYAPGSNARINLDSQWENAKTIAANKMPGTIPQFMGSAQQALEKESSLQGANLNQLSDVLNKLKIPRDYQSYISNPKNPFVTELMNTQTVNDYFKMAYKDITGSEPSDDYIISAGNSAQQIRQRNNYQIKFLMDSYSNYQPYWDLINPTSKITGASTGATPQNNQQGGLQPIPQGAPSIPQGFKIGGGELPPINYKSILPQ